MKRYELMIEDKWESAEGRWVEYSDVEDAQAELEALRVQWQPIETAPQDKDLELLVFCSDTREQFVAYQRTLNGTWTYAKGKFGEVICRPTHWRPLPTPPEVTP